MNGGIPGVHVVVKPYKISYNKGKNVAGVTTYVEKNKNIKVGDNFQAKIPKLQSESSPSTFTENSN